MTHFIFLVNPTDNCQRLIHAIEQQGYEAGALIIMPQESFLFRDNPMVHHKFSSILHARNVQEAHKALTSHEEGKVVGLIPASESGINYTDIIANMLGLPCNPPHMIPARRDKSTMKAYARQAGLACANDQQCYTEDDLDAFMEQHDYPVVIKTPIGVSSCHVYVCYTREELAERFHQIQQAQLKSTCQFALLEEYVHGTEYAVNMFADGNTIHVTDIWRFVKITNDHAFHIYCHTILEDIKDEKFAELIPYAKSLAKAVGIERGPIHAEIKLQDDNKPVMIEITSRLASSNMCTCIQKISNFDPLTASILTSVHGTIMMPESIQFDQYAQLTFCHTDQEGIVAGIYGMEHIKQLPSYHTHVEKVNIGDKVYPTKDLHSITLEVQLLHEDRAVLKRDAETVHDAFSLVTAPILQEAS